MIDPTKVTNFNRNQEEMEEFLLFCIIVAGKNAFQQAKKLDEFLKKLDTHKTPFSRILNIDFNGHLEETLRSVKMGQYHRISTAFRGVSAFLYQPPKDYSYVLKNVDVKYLECIKGIGMKTARFFLMHTRPNQQFACLDTHILKWLGERGHDVPKQTPNGQKYLWLEQAFLAYCREMQMTPAELDLKIWNEAHPGIIKISP